MHQRFQGKTVVVTGGTSGIGLAAAKRFVEEGAKVWVLGRGEAALEGAQRALGDGAHGVRGDVTSPPDLVRLFAEAKRHSGAIDVLVVNAAVVKLAPIEATTDAVWDEVVSTNMKGAFDTLRLGASALRDGAAVVVTTSWLNRIGFSGSAAVAMTKAALRALVRVAAAELAPRRIRVNALSPGAIETPLWGKLGLSAEALAAAGRHITAQIPLGRWGSPDEVARALTFLASDEASYINGIELQVDGGMRQA